MMSEIKLPAIIKYTMHNHIALCFKNGRAYHLDGEFKGEWSYDYYIDHTARNHTAEYLANTYGEVKNKEHAEFIVKLSGGDSSSIGNSWSQTLKCFVIDSDGKVSFGSRVYYQEKVGKKQITIPLPPECESVDEWPKVGDDVMFTDLLQHYDAYRDNYCLKTSKVIARFNTEQGEFITVHREYCAVMTVRVDMVLKDGALVKPKTPEQELRDLLLLLWEENNHDFDMLLDVVIEHVIKKPQ